MAVSRAIRVSGVTFGKYLLHDRLGAGGMAEVWAATLPGASGIDKRCVIKRILPRYMTDERFVRMFHAEARLSIALQHGNVVPVFDFGEVDGTHYLAMEWIDGKDLGRVLDRARDLRAPFPLPLALHVAIEVCRGLAYVHAKEGPDGAPLRLVHRDVSPSNVLVSWEGDVKLADFGIAKMLTTLGDTREHELKGKISYMAPEQARGESVDARTDVYSAGLVLWEMCTGRRPLETRSREEALARRRSADPIPVPSTVRPDVPVALDHLLARALAPRPVDRPAEMKELIAELAPLLARLAPATTASDLGAYVKRLFAGDDAEAMTRARTRPLARAADTIEPRTGQARPAIHDARTEELEPDTRPVVALPEDAATGTAPLPLPAERVTARLKRPARRGAWIALTAVLFATGAAAVVAGSMGERAREPEARAAPPIATPEPHAVRPVVAPDAPAAPRGAEPEAPPATPVVAPAPAGGADGPLAPAAPERGGVGVRAAARATGRLEVTTRPWAEVIVDGRRRAESTPAVISLPAGLHTVRLVNPEAGVSHVERVRIEPGETTRLARRLR